MPVVGDLKIRIRAITTDLRANLAKASSLIRDWSLLSTGLTAGVTTAFQNVAKIGIGAVKAALLGLGGAFAVVTAQGASFQDNMVRTFSILKRGSGATTEDFMVLREEARKIGKDTLASATQASEGMQILARAGKDTRGILESIRPIVDLSIVGNLELADSAKIVTQTLSQFNLRTKDAAKVADILTVASIKSNTTVEQIGTALKYVGNVAHAAGMSLEETVASIMATSNAGIQASKSGTTLRQAISKLLAPTGRAGKIFKEYGVDVKKSNGEFKDFPQIIKEVTKASRDAGETMEAFGKRGGTAILAILQQARAIRGEFLPALRDSKGAAHDVSQDFRTTLIGRIKDLRASLENLGGAFFDNFVGPLSEGIFSIRNFAVAIEETGKKTGFFKAVVAGIGNALSPINKLVSDLAERFLRMFENITADDVLAFFENLRVKIAEFIASLTGGEIRDTLVATFTIANAMVKTFIAGVQLAVKLWGLIPPQLRPVAAGIAIITAGILAMVGGLTNIVFQWIAILALIGPAGKGFALVGSVITGTILPAIGAFLAAVGNIVAMVAVMATLFIGLTAIFRFVSELKTGAAFVELISAGWQEVNARIMQAVATVKLYKSALAGGKGIDQAADAVVKAEQDLASAQQRRRAAQKATSKAFGSDVKMTKKDFDLTSAENRVNRTLDEILMLFKDGTENMMTSLKTTTDTVASKALQGVNLGASGDTSVLQGLDAKNLAPTKSSGLLNIGNQTLESFVTNMKDFGTQNIEKVEVSGEKTITALTSIGESIKVMSTRQVENQESLRQAVEQLNAKIKMLEAQVVRQGIKPSETRDKKPSPDSGIK